MKAKLLSIVMVIMIRDYYILSSKLPKEVASSPFANPENRNLPINLVQNHTF